MNADGLELIRTRRVIRSLTGDPVAREQIETILEAAGHAPNAGNRRLQTFVVVDDPGLLRVLRMVAPGMLQRPTAAIVVCVDVDRAAAFGFAPAARGLFIDVGTVAQTMLLAAHALGLGAGPVTSFSQAAVRAALNLPPALRPELLICLGHPAAAQPAPMAAQRGRSWRALTHWGPYPAVSAEPG
jgi:nitroreductase